MSIAIPNRWTLRAVVPWGVLALGVTLCVVAVSVMIRGRGAPIASAEAAGQSLEAAEGGTTGALPTTVTLPLGKVAKADLGFDRAVLESLPIELGVPGRIEANQDRQVQVRPRASGVVREVKVALGQAVKKGQALVVLDSPDVGTARLHLRARQRELSTARAKADWEKEVARNVTELIPELRKRLDEQHEEHPGGSHAPMVALEKESEVMEKHYADRNLGSFRATLMTAAVEFDIAAHEEEKTGGLYRKEILGEHPAFLAKHNREGAEARFRGVLATAAFDAAYQSRLAEQDLQLAESNVIDAAQRLRVLGVPEDVGALIAGAGQAAAARTAAEDVTAYTIAAPFDCTVISRSPLAVPSQKIEMNDVLFGLADLSTVWVRADIPESEFVVLPAVQEGTIRINAPAYPGRSLEAKLLSIGATVDPTTRTVPMLAETANPSGLLKLGMFVRIVLDTADEAKGVTVPKSALIEIEGKPGVFVPETKAPKGGGRAFAFRTVKLGRESGSRQEITSGLAVGEVVVSKNAFLLKSELILQNEADEE